MSNRIAVMRLGDVMQVGSPQDIYERPANLFVAEFIGDANFLPATCIARQGPGGRFRLGLAANEQVLIDSPNANGLAVGAKAVLVARPERATLVPPSDTVFTGDVQDAIYSGSDLTLHIVLAGGLKVRVRVTGAPGSAIPVGTRTGLAFPQDAIKVFAA